MYVCVFEQEGRQEILSSDTLGLVNIHGAVNMAGTSGGFPGESISCETLSERECH